MNHISSHKGFKDVAHLNSLPAAVFTVISLCTLGWRRASRIAVSLGVVQSITHRHHHGLQHSNHRLVPDLASLSANLDLSLSSRLLSLWILASSLSNQAKVPT